MTKTKTIIDSLKSFSNFLTEIEPILFKLMVIAFFLIEMGRLIIVRAALWP